MRLQFIAVAFALVVAGCATNPGSLTGVVNDPKNVSLRTPEYEVCGITGDDQRWINVTTEALVDGFNQPRPKARPCVRSAPAPKAAPKQNPKAKAAAKAKPAAKPKAKPRGWRPPPPALQS